MLLVSLRFPPHAGSGAQRLACFARYLPDWGWAPHVLTGAVEDGRRLRDPTLLELIPPGVEVTRARAFDTRAAFTALGRLHVARVARVLSLSFPQMESGWIPRAYRAGARLLDRGRFDVIFSSAYPLASHVVACLLKRRSGLPWVADYRDEWSLRSILAWPTAAHRRLGRRLDRALVAAADRVITTSPAHTARFREAFSSREPEKVVTITNGFDPSDLPSGLRGEDGPARGPFTIAHVGSLFEWRRPDAVVEAVGRLVSEGVVPPRGVRIRFVGPGSERVAAGWDGGLVERCGHVPHREAVGCMQEAHVLLLLNTESTNIPAKTFEYLATGRPILAVVRPGPTADLVREAGAGVVVDPDDGPGIASAVAALYRRWSGREWPALRVATLMRGYTRREAARRLSGVLREAIGGPIARSDLEETGAAGGATRAPVGC